MFDDKQVNVTNSPNSSVTVETIKYRDVVHFKCPKGSIVNGTSNGTCMADGVVEIQGPNPNCKSNLFDYELFMSLTIILRKKLMKLELSIFINIKYK